MKLRYADIQGFMSMDSIPDKPHRLPFGDVTVLLGANGSGKSNVLTFFRMLSSLSESKLQNFVARRGLSAALWAKAYGVFSFLPFICNNTCRLL